MGKFLKQIYMDEVPQLWNIIKGDMSIVGPRPLNEAVYNERFMSVVPAIAVIKAGLTGPFQSYKGIDGRSDINLNAGYVNEYKMRNGPSLVIYDISVIFRTIKVVLLAKGI
jgi:lipopolysaccharide/colanic/teichoic acid biosynthesis glycosyltransferase